MRLHRLGAHAKATRDVLVPATFGKKLDDLTLATSQDGRFASPPASGFTASTQERIQDGSRHSRAEKWLVSQKRLDRSNDGAWRIRLHQKASRAHGKDLRQQLLGFVDGEDQQ